MTIPIPLVTTSRSLLCPESTAEPWHFREGETISIIIVITILIVIIVVMLHIATLPADSSPAKGEPSNPPSSSTATLFQAAIVGHPSPLQFQSQPQLSPGPPQETTGSETQAAKMAAGWKVKEPHHDAATGGQERQQLQVEGGHGSGEEMTVAEFLFRRLKAMGVTKVFEVPGDFSFNVLNAVVRMDGIDYISAENELNAAYAADGYARIKGLGAVVTTFGVGEMSAINAVAGAYSENIPVVAITGVPAHELTSQNKLLHHSLGDGRYDHYMKMYSHITVAQSLLTDSDKAAAEIDRVLSACISSSKPVYLGIPIDICDEKIVASENPDLPLSAACDKNNLEAAISALEDLLSSAKKPLLVVDVGVRTARCEGELISLAERTRLPVALLPGAMGAFPTDHDCYIGTVLPQSTLLPAAKESEEEGRREGEGKGEGGEEEEEHQGKEGQNVDSTESQSKSPVLKDLAEADRVILLGAEYGWNDVNSFRFLNPLPPFDSLTRVKLHSVHIPHIGEAAKRDFLSVPMVKLLSGLCIGSELTNPTGAGPVIIPSPKDAPSAFVEEAAAPTQVETLRASGKENEGKESLNEPAPSREGKQIVSESSAEGNLKGLGEGKEEREAGLWQTAEKKVEMLEEDEEDEEAAKARGGQAPAGPDEEEEKKEEEETQAGESEKPASALAPIVGEESFQGTGAHIQAHGITGDGLWSELERFFLPGDIIVCDIGTSSMSLERAKLPRGATVMHQEFFGSIGWATPAAVGAAAADPKRRVVLITGDGSLQLTVQSLSMMTRYSQHAKIVAVVVNNGGYTIEKLLLGETDMPYNDVQPWSYHQLPDMFRDVGGWETAHALDASKSTSIEELREKVDHVLGPRPIGVRVWTMPELRSALAMEAVRPLQVAHYKESSPATIAEGESEKEVPVAVGTTTSSSTKGRQGDGATEDSESETVTQGRLVLIECMVAPLSIPRCISHNNSD